MTMAREYVLLQDIRDVEMKFVLSLIADGVSEQIYNCRPKADRLAKLSSLPVERVEQIIARLIDAGILFPDPDEEGWYILAGFKQWYAAYQADLKAYIAETFPHMRAK